MNGTNVEMIKPNLMVHAKGEGSMKGASGIHVGTVDHLDGKNWIKLKKTDSEDQRHHWIPVEWVESVDDKAVYLNKTPSQIKQDEGRREDSLH